MNILVGCDPEVFVKQGDVFKSAFGLIRGDKKNPQKIRNGAVQVDGMALEFNINPAASEAEFLLNVQDVFDQMCKMVPGYEVVASPVAFFDPEYLKNQPAAALELGCDPDYDGWTGIPNDKPDAQRPMRTASGHVHIGWTDNQNTDDKDYRIKCDVVAQQMDFFLGLGSLMFDSDVLRREMYGKATCLRYKPYGMEYRTLSNAWLRSENLIRWVYRNTTEGMRRLMSGDNLASKYGTEARDIINNSDKKAAITIMQRENIEVCYG